jgi:hypothetical protein
MEILQSLLKESVSLKHATLISTRQGRALGCGVGILGASPEQPQQDLAGPAGLLRVLVVAPVARRAGTGRRPADQPWEGEGVGLLVLGHLRQSMLRLAWLVALGSHGDMMPDPGRVTRDRAPAPPSTQSSRPEGRILSGLAHEPF